MHPAILGDTRWRYTINTTRQCPPIRRRHYLRKEMVVHSLRLRIGEGFTHARKLLFDDAPGRHQRFCCAPGILAYVGIDPLVCRSLCLLINGHGEGVMSAKYGVIYL